MIFFLHALEAMNFPLSRETTKEVPNPHLSSKTFIFSETENILNAYIYMQRQRNVNDSVYKSLILI